MSLNKERKKHAMFCKSAQEAFLILPSLSEWQFVSLSLSSSFSSQKLVTREVKGGKVRKKESVLTISVECTSYFRLLSSSSFSSFFSAILSTGSRAQ